PPAAASHRCSTPRARAQAKLRTSAVRSTRRTIRRRRATILFLSSSTTPSTSTRHSVPPGANCNACHGRRLACRPDSRMAIGPSCSSHTPSGGTGRPSRRVEPTKRSEEHTSELQSRENLVCRLLLEKKKKINRQNRAEKTKHRLRYEEYSKPR